MCFEERKTPMRCIVVLSGLAAICGIMMVVFTFLIGGNSLIEKVEGEDLLDIEGYMNFIFAALLIFSLATIAISVLGFFFICCKNRPFACLYGIILLPSWIVLVTVGFVSIAASVVASDAINDICNDIVSAADTGVRNDNVNIYLDIYEQIAIAEEMCSENCPCKPTLKSTDWSDDLSFGDRVFDFTGKYTTYKECIVDEENEDAGIFFRRFAENFREQDNFAEISDWIDFFEEEFDCAGICQPSLFYWGKPVDAGRPSKSCVDSIKDDITSAFTGLAAATFVSGVLLFIAFIMQYCLWRKFDD